MLINRKSIRCLLLIVCLLVGSILMGCSNNNPIDDSTQNTESTEIVQGNTEVVYIEESNYINDNLDYLPVEEVPVTFFWSDIQYADNEAIIAYLQEMGVSEITIPVAWSLIEPEKGQYDFELFDEKLQLYVDAGFKFVFVLDTGGRHIVDENKDYLKDSIPEWVWEEGGTKYVNFHGKVEGQTCFDYANESNIKMILEFYDVVIKHLSDNYKENILGFAPGIMWEFEIKMPQIGFAWSTYSEEAEEKFHVFLKERYEDIELLNAECGTAYATWEEIQLPVIDYNNSIIASSLTDKPMYIDFMEYREQLIVDFVSPLYDFIHANGYQTYSYFCQVLHPHDGIYAAGVVEDLADKVDVAVIDYNFYDGYDVVLDSVIPAFMVNYVKNLGDEKVLAGIYLERIDNPKYYDFVQESLDYVEMCGLADGYEVGNSSNTKEPYEFALTERQENAEIAIYVSELNFYKDHGEQESYIDYFTDSVAQMYKIIQFELGYDVDIISDDAVLDGFINDYELVVLPGQYYVDAEVKALICEYYENGGKLLQDIRFGEHNQFGENTGDWADEIFGITGRSAVVDTVDLIWNPNMQMSGYSVVRAYAGAIPTCFAIAGDGEGAYLFSDYNGNQYGISNENAILLCWQPQLMYKYALTVEEQAYAVQVIDAVVTDLLN